MPTEPDENARKRIGDNDPPEVVASIEEARRRRAEDTARLRAAQRKTPRQAPPAR